MMSSNVEYEHEHPTSCKHLRKFSSYEQLTEMNLSHMKLVNIDLFPFERYPNLHSLDLSYNQLTLINSDWAKLYKNHIKNLNLSHNKLETLLFLKDFKYLNTLNITDNLLRNNERFLSLHLCPTLEHLIDADQEEIHHDQLKLDQFLLLVETNVNRLWTLCHQEKNQKDEKKSQKSQDNFHRSLIKLIEGEKIFSKFHLSLSGNYFIEKKFNELNSQSQQTLKTYLTDDFNVLMNIEAIPKYSFEPIKYFRCHHKSDVDLLTTNISMCAFEPNTTKNILATCGGQKICFIDCDTCEITHLFEVNTLQSAAALATPKNLMTKDKSKTNNLEQFSSLCWIEIENVDENLKILAVGSTNGHIYLISPQWNLMFGHIELSVSDIYPYYFNNSS